MTENIYTQCPSCKESVPDIGKYCPHCAAYIGSKTDINDAGFGDQAEYYIYQAAEEIIDSGGKITQNEVGRIVVTGAAASAVVGLTAVGIAAGIFAGVGLGAYRHIRSKILD